MTNYVWVECALCHGTFKEHDLRSVGEEEYCEDCAQDAEDLIRDAECEYAAECDGPDPHGYRDPTPEQEAGWAFDDKLAMYRNEY